jgi:hypothetical protein
VHMEYEIHLRGALDDGLGAFLAEYDLGDLQADVVLRDLRLSLTALRALLERATTLGVAVVDVRAEAQPSNGDGTVDGDVRRE